MYRCLKQQVQLCKSKTSQRQHFQLTGRICCQQQWVTSWTTGAWPRTLPGSDWCRPSALKKPQKFPLKAAALHRTVLELTWHVHGRRSISSWRLFLSSSKQSKPLSYSSIKGIYEITRWGGILKLKIYYTNKVKRNLSIFVGDGGVLGMKFRVSHT